jgi:hypothetical protein
MRFPFGMGGRSGRGHALERQEFRIKDRSFGENLISFNSADVSLIFSNNPTELSYRAAGRRS